MRPDVDWYIGTVYTSVYVSSSGAQGGGGG